MSKFRDGLFGPTIILFAICFLITMALAAVYNITEPVIAQGKITAADAGRKEVLKAGASFTKIEVELPVGVTEAYRADNGSGYVFTSQARGYGGQVVYMIGTDVAGRVVGIKMLPHEETPGLGTKVGEEKYLEKYLDDVDPATVDAVSGATRTSNSLKNSLAQARDAYDLVKEVA